MTEKQKGILAIIGACLLWGMSPIFYKELVHIPPLELLAHRTGWSFVFFAGLLAMQGRLGAIRSALSNWRHVRLIAMASAMVSINWFIFIMSVQTGRTTEASLGYYIFPLVAVLVGRFWFGELLNRAQWISIGLVAVAVGILTWGLGVAPWISLVLAVSFSFYSAIKKNLSIGPVVSVTCEVMFFLPVGLTILMVQYSAGNSAFGRTFWDSGMLIFSGPLTAAPLILFSYSARRVSLATVGLLQYINPTTQFLCAVLLFGELFTYWHQVTFVLIWVAIVIFSLGSLRQNRALHKAPATPSERPTQGNKT